MDTSAILVLNAGSSSLKTELFDDALTSVMSADITGIGGRGRFTLGGRDEAVTTADHAEALDIVMTGLDLSGYPLHRLAAAAHRVVHGGAGLTAPATGAPSSRCPRDRCPRDPVPPRPGAWPARPASHVN